MERRSLGQALLVFVGAMVLGTWLVARLDGLEEAERRRAALELARGSASAIEDDLGGAMVSATILAALVDEGATDAQLGSVATRLLEHLAHTANLQLAKDCVISHLWPLRGNEAAAGLDLLASPIHGPLVRQVIERRRPLLYGPFPLIQGGVGLALRVPVVLHGAGGERVWGLASAILRLPALLERSHLTRLAEAGFDYELTRQAQGELPALVVAASAAGVPLPGAPESVALAAPGQTWTLRLAPRAGWLDERLRWLRLAGVLLVALLAGGLAYRVLSLPAVLRREVAARTRELEVAHQEQQRAEAAQRRSQRLESLGLLAGGVAHDFNNLLVGILGHADLLASEAAPGSQQEEAARTIVAAARRAAQLTRQLLAVARLGRQRQEEVDAHAVAREVATLLGRTLDKAIRVELRLEAPQHHVLGDPGQLQQVLLNLAVNARDAMPAGGTLTLATSLEEPGAGGEASGLPPGRYLVISVSDTGVGIPRDHLDRLFEPFFTTKEEGRGSGLGLATAYGIVKGHGGALRVQSQEGVGSTFTVHLPVHAHVEAAAPAPAATSPRGAGKVLVVDDEELVRGTAARMLGSLGYQPVLAAGGQAALDWIDTQSAPPAVVLLDLVMPGLDGVACFRALRARHPGLRVVISSGFARDGRAQLLLDEGAAGFVQKPYETAELARAMAAATGAPA